MAIENVRAVSRPDYVDAYLSSQTADDDAPPEHELDSAKCVALHGKLIQWYQDEQDRQGPNRFQQAIDADFYDSLQWSEEDAEALKARGQAPLVINQIKPTVDWVLGTEKRTRIDFKVLPREEDDVKGAEVKTKVLKYISDVNHTQFNRSKAFADAVKVGVGWIEVGIRSEFDAEPIFDRAESWRNILYDSNSIAADLSDARYIFRHKWVDVDIAAGWFPDRADKVKGAATGSLTTEQDEELWYLGRRMSDPNEDWTTGGRRTPYGQSLPSTSRERVKLIECWFREPGIIPTLVGGPLHGTEFDDSNTTHLDAVEQGISAVFNRRGMRLHMVVMTEDAILYKGPSPYKHDRFPFVPIWCYRRDRDNAPYGIIRAIRDPQEDLNKRASKALFILSTNRITAEEGAVEDWDELRAEAARPDGLIVKRRGAELAIETDKQLAEEHLTLMDIDSRIIREVGGVTSENLGRETNATSGKAILARQEQGSVVTAEMFDNYRFSGQLLGEIQLSLVEQFYTRPKIVRLTSERGALDWTRINQVQPDGSVLNDITARKADFVISEQDYRASLRQAMFEQLVELTGKLPPEVSLQLLDLVVELADVPNKDELARRIRGLNGHMDPDQAEPTPEEAQAIAARQAQQQQEQQIAQQAAQLAVEEQAAKVEKLRAEAQEVMARVQQLMNPQPTTEAPVDTRAIQESARVEFEGRLNKLAQAAESARASLQAEVDRLKVEAANRAAELQQQARDAAATAATELRKAEIEAEAMVNVAKVNAASKEQTDALMGRIDALGDVLKRMAEDAVKREEAATAQRKQEEKDRQAREKVEAAESRAKDAEVKAVTPAQKADASPVESALAAAITGLTAVVGEISKPKVLIKDKDGKPVGVRTLGTKEEGEK